MVSIQTLKGKMTGKINQIDRVDLLEYMLQLLEEEQREVPFRLTAKQENEVSKKPNQDENNIYHQT